MPSQSREKPTSFYSGPPSYPVPPRWGIPQLTWSWSRDSAQKDRDEAVDLFFVRRLARWAEIALWFLVAVAIAAAAGEFWRYGLLLQSRHSALSETVVAASDMMVGVAAFFALSFALVSFFLTGWWFLLARNFAAAKARQQPARSFRQLIVGTVIPGINFMLPGAALAELEHVLFERKPDVRPKPSMLIWCWWVAWIVNWLLLGAVLLWRFRSGVQAQADAVVLTGVVDLSAAILAGVTAVVVHRMTYLLAPMSSNPQQLPLVVKAVSEPKLLPRMARSPHARR